MKLKEFFAKSKKKIKGCVLAIVAVFVVFFIIAIIATWGIPTIDNIKTPTNQSPIAVTGKISSKNTEATIYLNGSEIAKSQSDDSGKFKFENVELKEGENKITVSFINDKGKTKTSNPKKVVYDITPPSLEIESPQSPTDKDKAEIKGKSENNTEIKLFKDDQEIKTAKAKYGNFTFKNISLNETENKFYLTAQDQAGNVSEKKEIAIIYQPPKEPEKTPEAPKTEETKLEPAEATTQATEQPKPEKTTMDKLWEALDQSLKTREGYDIKYDSNFKSVLLTREPESSWDETEFVRSVYTDYVKYGLKSFQIDNVDSIQLIYWANMTDQYGKTEKEKGVQLEMKKDEFQKYNWKNLEGQNIYNQMLNSCSTHWINIGIKKNIDTNKLYLGFL